MGSIKTAGGQEYSMTKQYRFHLPSVISRALILAAVPGAGALLIASVMQTPASANQSSHQSHQSNQSHQMTGGASSRMSASALRSTLNQLLSEHAYLAAAATGAALGGRQDEFQAAASALDGNSVDLAKQIGWAYGADAEQAFLALWRRHIGFFVDYTTGVATKDAAMQERAVNDLIGYSRDFAAFINAANGLPVDVVADLVRMHVVGLKDVVDAQAAGDTVKAYMWLREAAGHMGMIADPLTEATVTKFPNKFS
jgi:hypothetical protein